MSYTVQQTATDSGYAACVLELSHNSQRLLRDDWLPVRGCRRISRFTSSQNRIALKVEIQPILPTHGATNVISLDLVKLGHAHSVACFRVKIEVPRTMMNQ
jgi:hypothetical protein